uniref:Large ribosomal subunit protein uL18c n=1 Tax=Digenea simplex TaxID=945030 RepID=A0A1Z1MUN9_DIGSM|nr:ribosomal protein L18 [Digenea simplex]ARW69589.1 ribosomal protein L18 [Digenea simplex]
MKTKHKSKHRLYIVKSCKHIYAHIIDNQTSKIITTSSTASKEIKSKGQNFRNCCTAKLVGQNIALKLKDLGIQNIIFDRGRNKYHGQVEALAEAARKEGIIF